MTWDKLDATVKAGRALDGTTQFIDLMLDVVKAAEGIKRTIDEGFDDRVEESVIDICQKEYLALEAGLAALRAAVDKLPE